MSNRQTVKLEYNENKLLSGYSCNICNSYNDILTSRCWNCQSYRPNSLEILAARVSIQRTGEFIAMAESKTIELHTKFFMEERILIKDMDSVQIRERRAKFELIALEARSRITAEDAEERERNSKLTKEQRDWLISNPGIDPNVSDRLIKEKKQRQSKADKLLESMKKLGIANADELMKEVHRKATDKQVNSISFTPTEKPVTTSALCDCNRHSECAGRFMSENVSHACECACHKLAQESIAQNELSMMCDAGMHDCCMSPSDCGCSCHKENK